jgi:hypothetical protein
MQQSSKVVRQCGPNQSLPVGHHLTINVTGILTGCTLELELVAVTVIVKVPGGRSLRWWRSRTSSAATDAKQHSERASRKNPGAESGVVTTLQP